MDKEILKTKVRYLYNKWLNQKAKEIFITKINKYSKIIGVRGPQIVILKNLKNRWGNNPSIRVLEKNGFVKTNELNEYHPLSNRYRKSLICTLKNKNNKFHSTYLYQRGSVGSNTDSGSKRGVQCRNINTCI
jgi:hypothetical protein